MDNFNYYFYNTDHLGNIREVVDATGHVMQATSYYPFGTPISDRHSAINPDLQPFKYNGKELDMMHGLNTYDYGARQYASRTQMSMKKKGGKADTAPLSTIL